MSERSADYTGLVYREAYRLAKRTAPRYMAEDLVGDGWLGLAAARARYDPSLSAFTTFAVPRIRYAMIDGIRAMEGRADRPGMERALGRAVPLSRAVTIRGEPGRTPLEALLPAEGRTDDDVVRESEILALRRALARLPAPERIVLTLYYYDGMGLKAIGATLGFSEVRASQLKAKGVAALRRRLLRR